MISYEKLTSLPGFDKAAAVFNPLLLTLVSNDRQMALIYDAAGEPLWAFNRTLHTYSNFLEYLCHHRLQESYHLPDVPDFNRLFDNSPQGSITFREPELNRILSALSGANFIPLYPSRNIFETIGLDPIISKTDMPLSPVRLVRLSPEMFLGLIKLDELFILQTQLDDKFIMLTDDESRVTGYSSRFTGLLKLDRFDDLIGRPITGLFNFEGQEAQQDDLEGIPFAPHFIWDPGIPWKTLFHQPQGQGHEISQDSRGMRWRNASGTGYAWLEAEGRYDPDKNHLRIDMECPPGTDNMPNLMFRCVSLGRLKDPFTETPDGIGYNLSWDRAASRLLLKKQGKPVFTAPTPMIEPDKPALITLIKQHRNFILKVNGTTAGQWIDMNPPEESSDGLIYLFLRPGMEGSLRSLKISLTPVAGRITPARSAVSVKFKPLPLFFQASSQPFIQGGKNRTLYFFHDVTPLMNDLHLLEAQKKTLQSLLRRAGGLLGQSPMISAMRESLPVIARSDLSVLIEGETGTGKEVLARELHQAGDRADKPFVKIDCATLPENLIESQLFGHEKGAFTGAIGSHSGFFEQADKGTVFLDEVANIPAGAQAKLLNVLQDRKVRRIGGTRAVPLDIRLICASNVPLKELIRQGRFREDLYYRLNQYRYSLPPLRERREDIPLLADQFLREANELYGKKIEGILPKASDILNKAKWPGNVRELRNTVLKAALLSKGTVIGPEDISLESEKAAALGLKAKPKKTAMTKKILEQHLKDHQGNLKALAETVGVSRPTVYGWLLRHGIRIGKYR